MFAYLKAGSKKLISISSSYNVPMFLYVQGRKKEKEEKSFNL